MANTVIDLRIRIYDGEADPNEVADVVAAELLDQFGIANTVDVTNAH